jgi:hypothetical protein
MDKGTIERARKGVLRPKVGKKKGRWWSRERETLFVQQTTPYPIKELVTKSITYHSFALR